MSPSGLAETPWALAAAKRALRPRGRWTTRCAAAIAEIVGSTNTVCSVGLSLEVQHDACASPRNTGFAVSRNRRCERLPALVKRASAALDESSISDPRLGSFRAGRPRRRRFAVRRWRAAQQPHKTGVVSRAHPPPAVAAASQASRNTYLTGTHTAGARKRTPAPSWNWRS